MAIVVAAALVPLAAVAAPCPGHPDALGTERVLAVDANSTPRVGRKSFPDTLPLQRKELVLTFDDGPWPGTTPKVLDALKHECVRATFFLLGRNVAAHPAIARRESRRRPHRRPSHLFASRCSTGWRSPKPKPRSIAASRKTNCALYGQRRSDPGTPFFRFPGFASNRVLLDRLQARHIVVFGADVWASDWLPMTSRAGIAPDPCPDRADRQRHRAVSRHQDADRGDAAGLPARAQAARLPHRSRGAGRKSRQFQLKSLICGPFIVVNIPLIFVFVASRSLANSGDAPSGAHWRGLGLECAI